MAEVNPQTLQEQVRRYVAEDPVNGWDKAWQEGITPWDSGHAQLALQDLLQSQEVLFPNSGRALVPGCGRGYDAILISAILQLDTLAVDISPTAIDAARSLLLAEPNPEVRSKVRFELADFFALPESEEEKFNLIYDYTFFVALRPERRPDWAKKMAALTESGGFLITLVFPMNPPQDYGPPFFVRPEHYVEVLGNEWEKVVDKVPERSSDTHKGKEHIMVWKRK
ncbi:S-adenosyl-L-methionine-dependent methyltransferase [Panus rudis PR-1116 ss-1]|nr:S-adenosyl-L-methionine-dependent methyltransferase [Panus rudis PR-1116 ss-1]